MRRPGPHWGAVAPKVNKNISNVKFKQIHEIFTSAAQEQNRYREADLSKFVWGTRTVQVQKG